MESVCQRFPSCHLGEGCVVVVTHLPIVDEYGGLTARRADVAEAWHQVRSLREQVDRARLGATERAARLDLVEFHPGLDPTYKSALNSAFIVKACLTGIAMNREGKTAEHYLSPVASEHAIDDYYGDRQQHLDATTAEEEEAEQKKKERRERDR